MRQIFACFAAFLLLGGGVVLLSAPIAASDLRVTSSPPTAPDPAPEDPPKDESQDESCNRVKAVASYLGERGFAQRDHVIGVSAIDWSQSPAARAEHSFSTPLQNRQALRGFLEADYPAAVAARDIAGEVTVDYVPVQFLSPVFYAGNWHWKDGNAIKGGDRTVLAGDVWWMAIDGCEVSKGQSIRAVCGNVGFDRLSLAASRHS